MWLPPAGSRPPSPRDIVSRPQLSLVPPPHRRFEAGVLHPSLRSHSLVSEDDGEPTRSPPTPRIRELARQAKDIGCRLEMGGVVLTPRFP